MDQGPANPNPNGPRPTPAPDSQLSFAQKLALGIAILVLVAGLLVWIRLDFGEQVFETARLWLYRHYGLSVAWSTSLAAIAVAVIVANTWFILAAVLFGWRRKEALVVTALVAVSGAALHEYRTHDQCFDRATAEPLCDLYETSSGQFEIRRMDASAPPSTSRRLRTASEVDVRRYAASAEDRARRKPQPITFSGCSKDLAFFDTETGEAVVFFAVVNGVYELFSGPGFHPQTNDSLRPVDKSVVAKICRPQPHRQDAKESRQTVKPRPEEAQPAPIASTVDMPKNRLGLTLQETQDVRALAYRTFDFALAGDKDRFAEAFQLLSSLQKPLRGDRSTAEKLLQQAMTHWLKNEPAEASVLQERATQIDPSLAVSFQNLCMSYIKLGQLDKAEDAGLRALIVDSRFHGAWGCLTNVYAAKHNVEQTAGGILVQYRLSTNQPRMLGSLRESLTKPHYLPSLLEGTRKAVAIIDSHP